MGRRNFSCYPHLESARKGQLQASVPRKSPCASTPDYDRSSGTLGHKQVEMRESQEQAPQKYNAGTVPSFGNLAKTS